MAAPQLKKTAVVAPTRKLINSGVVPTKQVRLKGSNGQAIQPKAPTPLTKKKEVEKPAPAEEEVAASATPEIAPEGPTPEELEAQQAYEKEMEEYNRQMEEYNKQMAEYERQMAEAAAEEEARKKAEEEEEAKRKAEEEEARKKAEEEEAKRKAEEEEARKKAEEEEAQKKAEEEEASEPAASEPVSTPAPAADPEPDSEPNPTPAPAKKPGLKPAGAAISLKPTTPGAAKGSLKPGAAKTAGGSKPAAAKPSAALLSKANAAAAKKAAPAETPAEEDPTDDAKAADTAATIREVDESYVNQLRAEATKKPIYKSTGFYTCCIALLAFGGICGYLIIKDNQEKEAKRAQNEKTMKILRRAQAINKEGVETLADAKVKKINVDCTQEEVQFLMNIVVNPAMKDDKGKPMFGGHPEGVAQLACMLASIAAESNDDLSKYIFDRLDKDASKIKPSLYRWLVHRLAATNIKGLNSKLHKLASAVSKQGDAKTFPKRGEILSIIWEGMGLRVTEKDVKPIIQMLKEKDQDSALTRTLISCLDNIVLLSDDKDKKRELGDRIFNDLPKSMRPEAIVIFAKTCSPKALEYYKGRIGNTKNWVTDGKFFSNYGSDEVVPIIQEMKETAGNDERLLKTVNQIFSGLFSQNHDRTPEEAKNLMSLVPDYDKVDMDTSNWDEVNWKTDPDSADFIGESSPEYESLMKQRADMNASREQKLALIRVLSSMYDYPWVVQYLEKFADEADVELSKSAKNGLEKVKNNRINHDLTISKYRSRDKS